MIILMIGIVFFGIGIMMGINLVLIVGVIILGVIFGDKILLLLDLINLVVVIVEVDLFDYICNLMWFMIFVFVVLLVFYVVLGVGVVI